MRKLLFNNKGFSLTEVLFVAIITIIVVTGIVSTWSFTYARWTHESKKTLLRVDLMKTLEQIQHDILARFAIVETSRTDFEMPVKIFVAFNGQFFNSFLVRKSLLK